VKPALDVLKASMDSVFENIDASGIDKIKQVNTARARELLKGLAHINKKAAKFAVDFDINAYSAKLA
jgi:hypothetical protein